MLHDLCPWSATILLPQPFQLFTPGGPVLRHLWLFSPGQYHFLPLYNQFRTNSVMHACMHAQLCLTLCNPKDCSLPGSSVHGIFWARILEWVAIPFSRGSSSLRDWTWVSCIAGGFFTICRRAQQPILFFLPGESHGQRNLTGCCLHHLNQQGRVLN